MFPECLALINSHRLYKQALQIFTDTQSHQYREISCAYAEHLTGLAQHREAAIGEGTTHVEYKRISATCALVMLEVVYQWAPPSSVSEVWRAVCCHVLLGESWSLGECDVTISSAWSHPRRIEEDSSQDG